MEREKFSENFLNQANHRVKNNLQLVDSLLRIQARRYTSLTIDDFNKKSENRINTIKLIHDNIYYNKDEIDSVDMYSYVISLIKSLTDTFEFDIRNINFSITINEIVLELKSAIPIGLIINELVLNSVSHAFINNEKTNNTITLTLIEEKGKYLLIYKDNGQGYDRNLIKKSLGLEIIELLTQQMKAKLEESTTNGVEYKISF